MAIIGTRPADSDVMKNRRRTTTKAKRPSAPKVSGRRKPSGTNADTKVALLKRERDEALEQQRATSEVLHVIIAVARRTGAGIRGHSGKRNAHSARPSSACSTSIAVNVIATATRGAPAAFVDFACADRSKPAARTTALDRVVTNKNSQCMSSTSRGKGKPPLHSAAAVARRVVTSHVRADG